jgi:16S rRNA (guanine966-N2)-methyltransferase
MRVIAGSARSLRLECPQSLQIRPTTDMMRESLFNSLGPDIAGKPFCDLYAGCGAVGIEALSRGARPVVLVEKDRRCLKAIERNLANTDLAEAAVVVAGDVLAVYAGVAAKQGPFEVVFADPPYGYDRLSDLARRLALRGEGVAAGGVVVIQHSSTQELPDAPRPVREKSFGDSVLSFFEPVGADTQGP